MLAIKKAITSALLLFFSICADCQNRIDANISFGLQHSFSSDILKTHETEPAYVKVEYFSRKKFKYPYFKILANVSYAIAEKLNAGLQSGVYVHYLERYSSSERKTTLSVPLQLTSNYSIVKTKTHSFGVNAAAGILLFSLDEYIFKYKNSSLITYCFFYKHKNGGVLKIGLEKQADFITVNLKSISPNSPEESFKYRQLRLAATVSYGIVIK